MFRRVSQILITNIQNYRAIKNTPNSTKPEIKPQSPKQTIETIETNNKNNDTIKHESENKQFDMTYDQCCGNGCCFR